MVYLFVLLEATSDGAIDSKTPPSSPVSSAAKSNGPLKLRVQQSGAGTVRLVWEPVEQLKGARGSMLLEAFGRRIDEDMIHTTTISLY